MACCCKWIMVQVMYIYEKRPVKEIYTCEKRPVKESYVHITQGVRGLLFECIVIEVMYTYEKRPANEAYFRIHQSARGSHGQILMGCTVSFDMCRSLLTYICLLCIGLFCRISVSCFDIYMSLIYRSLTLSSSGICSLF